MSFLESFITGIFCMVVVFGVLASLYFLIQIFSFGIRNIDNAGKKSTQ
ncbi:MAG: OadG family protein [Eubacteriales bacterium]|nr:OadG family protein [Eubacteriales bacterium]